MSRVFWEWSKMILCFFSISYREVSFKFSLNKKEKDSGNLFSSNWTGFPVEEKRPCLLCHSKNKPPAMQGEDRSLDISMNSCAKIKVGLQNHK